MTIGKILRELRLTKTTADRFSIFYVFLGIGSEMFVFRHCCRWFVWFFVIGLIAPVYSVALEDSPEGPAQFNYAYSVFVGTGAYRIEDNKIYIFSVPLQWDMSEPDYESGKVGYRLLMPFSVGVTNFNTLDDLSDFDLDDVQTLTVTPGIEALIPVRPNWLVKPFAQVGMGWDMKTSANSKVFGAGARARGWYGENQNWLIGGEVLWARNRPGKDKQTTSFTRWGLGVEYKIPTQWSPFGHKVSWHARLLQYYFTNPVNFEEPDDEFAIKNSTEAGVSFSIDPPVYIMGYGFKQGGIGVEKAGNFRAIKLFTSFPF